MRSRTKTIKASIAVHCENDYFNPKTVEHSKVASCGFVIQLHSPKSLEMIELQLAACSEPASLYALATLHLVKLFPVKQGKAANKFIVALPDCNLAGRIDIARQLIASGGRRANGEAANDMPIWTELIELIDNGTVQFIYVNKDEHEEQWNIQHQLNLMAKAVALRSKANSFAHRNSVKHGSLFSEATVFPPPPKDVRNWSKP
jgi:hypothetical protein